MTDRFHILNGDALKEHFPAKLSGEIIVARECLVDGNINGHTLDELFANRALFISQNFKDFSIADYHKKSRSEFLRMQQIPEDAIINLWFEDDLFCQVNLWFVLHLLKTNRKKYQIHLVRPNTGNEYNFGNMNREDLVLAYENKISINSNEFNKLASLWTHYQNNELEKLIASATALKTNFPFLIPAIQAHSNRIPKNGNPGKPVQTLLEIVDELKTREFAPVFQAFCKREAIYGFGDEQVKRLLIELNDLSKKI